MLKNHCWSLSSVVNWSGDPRIVVFQALCGRSRNFSSTFSDAVLQRREIALSQQSLSLLPVDEDSQGGPSIRIWNVYCAYIHCSPPRPYWRQSLIQRTFYIFSGKPSSSWDHLTSWLTALERGGSRLLWRLLRVVTGGWVSPDWGQLGLKRHCLCCCCCCPAQQPRLSPLWSHLGHHLQHNGSQKLNPWIQRCL